MSIKKYFICVFSLFASFFFISFDSHGLDEKNFEQYNCRLSLPGKDWKWADGKAADSLCAAVEPSKTLIFALSAGKAQENARVDDEFLETFEQGFFKEGLVENRESSLIKWNETISYAGKAYFKTVNRMALIRIFIVNGIFYRLDIIGPPLFFEKNPDADRIFENFKFIKVPNGEAVDSYKFYLALCVIAILVLFALKVMFTKTKGGNSENKNSVEN